MTEEEYKDVMSMAPLKVLMAEKNLNNTSLAELIGSKAYIVGNWLAGRTFPDTESIAGICAALRCSVDKVVKFTGYDVNPRYENSWTGYGEPRWGKLTYEPLRMLFIGFYGKGLKWKKKLTEFYDGIPRPSVSKEKEEAREKRLKMLEDVREKNGRNSSSKDKKNLKGFLIGYRNAISMDNPIPLPRLYDICKALHCTPDWVMTYN